MITSETVAFGLAVREERIKRGLSHAELAQRTRVKAYRINDIEDGKLYPLPLNMGRFAIYLGLSKEYGKAVKYTTKAREEKSLQTVPPQAPTSSDRTDDAAKNGARSKQNQQYKNYSAEKIYVKRHINGRDVFVPVSKREPNSTLNISIPRSVKQSIEDRAVEKQISLSHVICEILENYLEGLV